MWYEALENNFFLLNLYDDVPKLIDVRISELNIKDEGNRISLVFDMPNYVDNPPKKWTKLEYNTTIVQVDFFGIKKLNILSFVNSYRGNIIIKKENNLIITQINGSTEININAEAGIIQSITGYIKENLEMN